MLGSVTSQEISTLDGAEETLWKNKKIKKIINNNNNKIVKNSNWFRKYIITVIQSH